MEQNQPLLSSTSPISVLHSLILNSKMDFYSLLLYSLKASLPTVFWIDLSLYIFLFLSQKGEKNPLICFFGSRFLFRRTKEKRMRMFYQIVTFGFLKDR